MARSQKLLMPVKAVDISAPGGRMWVSGVRVGFCVHPRRRSEPT